jgi:hypothetical protein
VIKVTLGIALTLRRSAVSRTDLRRGLATGAIYTSQQLAARFTDTEGYFRLGRLGLSAPQPPDCQDVRHRGAADAARHRRRGGRVKARMGTPRLLHCSRGPQLAQAV